MKLDPDRVPQGLGYANHHFIPVIVLCRSSLMHSSSIAQTDSVWQKGFSHKNNCVGTMCIIALGGGYHNPLLVVWRNHHSPCIGFFVPWDMLCTVKMKYYISVCHLGIHIYTLTEKEQIERYWLVWEGGGGAGGADHVELA